MSKARILVLVTVALALAACVAKQSTNAVSPTAPGFLEGMWHGFIFPIAWIISLFTDKISVYSVPNNGGWYDFGYFIGVVFLGVGARKTRIIYRDRNLIDVKAKRVQEVGE